MPDIAPATMPVQPATPATAPAAAPGTAAITATADPVGAAFLGQLTAALKALAGVMAKSAASPLQADPATNMPTATTEPSPLVATALPADTKTSDKPAADGLPEMLAALGIVLAPVPQQIATPVDATKPGQAGKQPTLPGQAAAAPVTPNAPAAPTTDAVVATPTEQALPSAPTTPAPPPAVRTASTGPAQKTTTSTAPAAPSTLTSPAVTAPPPPPLPPSTPVVPQTAHNPVPMVPAVQTGVTSDAAGFGQAQTGGGDSHQHKGDSAHGATVSEAAPAHPAASLEPSLPTLQLSTAQAGNAASTLPQNATPSDVASQIAHQAELFRLPGNKGVRIQLHPDDLGGVQVTLRYAGNTGGLELHINVEHAATGALVESGWGQLRDALANQGINPDRLVMSISGPQNANQLDFSSNNNGGGYRPDQNLANFSQSDQSGQQRGEDATSDERGGARGWNPNMDVQSTSASNDDSPRQTSASSARIDYRV